MCVTLCLVDTILKFSILSGQHHRLHAFGGSAFLPQPCGRSSGSPLSAVLGSRRGTLTSVSPFPFDLFLEAGNTHAGSPLVRLNSSNIWPLPKSWDHVPYLDLNSWTWTRFGFVLFQATCAVSPYSPPPPPLFSTNTARLNCSFDLGDKPGAPAHLALPRLLSNSEAMEFTNFKKVEGSRTPG